MTRNIHKLQKDIMKILENKEWLSTKEIVIKLGYKNTATSYVLSALEILYHDNYIVKGRSRTHHRGFVWHIFERTELKGDA